MAENDFQKNVVISVTTDTGDATKGLTDLKGKIEDIGDAKIDQPFKNLKTQLKEANNEAQRIAETLGKQSKEFGIAAQKVANLKDEFGKYKQTVDAFNPDNKLQAVVNIARGAVAGVQGISGAMAFLGVKSEDTMAVIAKLQGLMAFSDALGSIDAVKNSFTSFAAVIKSSTVFQALYNFVMNGSTKAAVVNTVAMEGNTVAVTATAAATTGATIAARALRIALIATGIGAVVVLLVAAAAAMGAFSDNTDDATDSVDALKAALEKSNSELGFTIDSLDQQAALKLEKMKQNGATQEQLNEQEVKNLREKEVAVAGLLKKAQNDLEDHYWNNARLNKARAEDDQTATKEEIDADKEKEALLLGNVKKLQDETTKLQYQGDLKEQTNITAAYEAKKKIHKKGDDAEAKAAKAHIDEMNKIALDANREVKDAGLSEKDRELAKIQESYDDQLIALNKLHDKSKASNEAYNKAKTAIDEKKRIDDLEITKKYNLLDFDEAKRQSELIAGAADTDSDVANRPNANDTPEQAKQKLRNKAATAQGKSDRKFTKDTDAAPSDADQIDLIAKHNQDTIDAKQALDDAIKAIDDETAQHLKDNDQQTFDNKLALLDATSSAIASTGSIIDDIAGKQTVTGKVLAIASATIDTYAAIAKTLNAFSKVPVPGYAIAQAIATGIFGLAQVIKIINTKVPKSGGAGGGAAPTISAPQISAAVLDPSIANKVSDVRVVNNNQTPIKAYITTSDLANSAAKQDLFNRLSSI